MMRSRSRWNSVRVGEAASGNRRPRDGPWIGGIGRAERTIGRGGHRLPRRPPVHAH